MRRRLLAWAPLGVAAAVLIWHSLQYNFVTDDAYISFVYSRNLAEHGELTFNLGDPVEGYTNFLWTFVLGILMLLGIPPEVSSLVLGTGCGIATLVVTYRLLVRLGVGAPWRYLPAFLLAFSAGFACWSSGGLETQLFTLLVVLAVDAYVAATVDRRALRRMGIYLALAAMTRPEGMLVAAVLGVHRLAINAAIERRYRPNVDEWLAIASFAAVWAPWFAWRWWYYGWPFPNTAYVKASGAWARPELADEMVRGGFYYVKAWLFQSGLVWALPVAVLGVVAHRVKNVLGKPAPRFVAGTLIGTLAAVYLAYTIKVGGDFMGLHRFIMPVTVLGAIAVALGFDWLAERIVPRIPRGALVAHAAAVLLVAGFAWAQIRLTATSLRWGNFLPDHGIDTPAFLIAYTEDRATIGRHMAACFRPDDFSIVGGAGAQPYYARMRAVDVFGLVSDRIAHNEKRIRARAGHTKFASDATLDTYNPTFVFSCYALHPTPDPPRLPCDEGRWLRKGYEKVTLLIPGLRQLGTYYTFFAKKERALQCPGRVR